MRPVVPAACLLAIGLATTACNASSDPVCGLGDACETNDDCGCDNVCSALSCVAPAACDEALLSFTSPVSNVDGSCATDLAGYYVYWGLESDLSDATQVDIGMPCVDDVELPCGEEGMTAMQRQCSYRLTDLPEGTVYIAVSTYNASGIESDRTGTARKVIVCP